MVYYTADNENLDGLRLMTTEEAIETYRLTIDDEPGRLADLYLNFHDFSQIEFLIFKDRLSSAILVSNAAKMTMLASQARFETIRNEGSHLVPGWEAESDIALDEAIRVAKDAYHLSIGATTVTAVAAVESLLLDLTPDTASRYAGLMKHLQAFLKRYNVPADQKAEVTTMGRTIGDRRNTFAHSLTGSYWQTDKTSAAMFTPETMEETLFLVGKIAVFMEELVLAGRPQP